MMTFLQTVEASLAIARANVLAEIPDIDRASLTAHLAFDATRAGKQWWLALEDAAYTGADVPLSVWRSAFREHAPSAKGLLGRWIRARPAQCPDAIKAAAMAQEMKNEAN